MGILSILIKAMTVENRKHQTTSRLFGFRKSSVLLLTILALVVLVDQSQAKSLRHLGPSKGHSDKSRHNKPKEYAETVTQEKKPEHKPEHKKEEHKPEPKKEEPKKEEPKKEEPKPEPKPEPVPEPKKVAPPPPPPPAPKPEPKKEAPKPKPAPIPVPKKEEPKPVMHKTHNDMSGKKVVYAKAKHANNGVHETAAISGGASPFADKPDTEVNNAKADLDEEDNKYHGSYLKKKLFRGMADLNMTITPDNEKKLLILAGGFVFFGVIAWCFCKCI